MPAWQQPSQPLQVGREKPVWVRPLDLGWEQPTHTLISAPISCTLWPATVVNLLMLAGHPYAYPLLLRLVGLRLGSYGFVSVFPFLGTS